MTVARPAPIDGISLAGWGTHDVIARGSWPADPLAGDREPLGRPAMPPERFGSQTPHTLGHLAHELRVATSQVAEIGARLYRREPWDLFLLVFGAPHRGGHYLWDLSQVDAREISGGRRRSLGEALSQVYRAADAGVGRILELVPQARACWSSRFTGWVPTLRGRIGAPRSCRGSCRAGRPAEPPGEG